MHENSKIPKIFDTRQNHIEMHQNPLIIKEEPQIKGTHHKTVVSDYFGCCQKICKYVFL